MLRIVEIKNMPAHHTIAIQQGFKNVNVFLDKHVHEFIENNDLFTYTEQTGGQVIHNLRQYKEIILIGYKTFWPWSKVMGYTKPTDKKTIWLNTRKKRTKDELASTILHEFCHLCGYSHGSNRANHTGYKESVPEVVQDAFNFWIEKG